MQSSVQECLLRDLGSLTLTNFEYLTSKQTDVVLLRLKQCNFDLALRSAENKEGKEGKKMTRDVKTRGLEMFGAVETSFAFPECHKILGTGFAWTTPRDACHVWHALQVLRKCFT